jgi:hypothetical protein
MAAGTVYLDVDDEITSAAARIRSSETTKVALVVPYGSRISTSRMNFRLLSREAVVNNRRLSIVAADAATRALAASAGLPVFATVAEYEAALAGPPTTGSVEDEDASIAAAGPVIAGTPIATASATVPPAKPASKRNARRDAAADETQAILFPTVAAAGAPTSAATPPTFTREAARPVSSGRESGRPRTDKTDGRPRVGTPVVAGIVALLLALAVIAVGGYLLLPAADITVTPSREAIGPLPLTITADPDATSVDTTNGVVPAVRLEIPVDVTETFTTTGVRTELKAAKGTVTFRSVNFLASNTIPAGSVVSTQNGTRFTTDRSVTVPKATFADPVVDPSFADVGVTAVKKGTAGNVEPNTITVIPAGEDPVTLSVRNKEATTGGAKNEFPRVDQKDIDAAVAALNTKLNDAFTAAVAAGAGAPTGTTLFPETAALGPALPSPDPLTLIGQEIETFDLGMSASGTVIAVDASPVKTIAQARLLSNVGTGYRLVDGSIRIDQGDPVVTGGVVSFPVTATAERVRIVDADALRAVVKGQSVDQARALLTPYGQVSITTWPGWVSSITGFDSRLTVTVDDQTGSSPGSSSAPGASRSPSPATSTAP